MQTCVQRSPDLDRDAAAASTIADLILGSELAQDGDEPEAGEPEAA